MIVYGQLTTLLAELGTWVWRFRPPVPQGRVGGGRKYPTVSSSPPSSRMPFLGLNYRPYLPDSM